METAKFNLKIWVAPNLGNGGFYCKCFPIDNDGKFERRWGVDEVFGTGATPEEAMKDCMTMIANKLGL